MVRLAFAYVGIEAVLLVYSGALRGGSDLPWPSWFRLRSPVWPWPRLGPLPRPSQTRPFLRRGPRHGHRDKRSDILRGMLAVKAHVRSGRIIVDEPTDLPEGAELDLVVVGNDDLDEEDELALLASLDRALDDEDADRAVNVNEFLEEVRAQT